MVHSGEGHSNGPAVCRVPAAGPIGVLFVSRRGVRALGDRAAAVLRAAADVAGLVVAAVGGRGHGEGAPKADVAVAVHGWGGGGGAGLRAGNPIAGSVVVVVYELSKACR